MTIKTILIANRGEIALRIIGTARRLGFRTVAVYSDADRGAPHCLAADMAVHIGASDPAASYLNIAALLAASAQSGADAVHPGYGFLAENAAFALACANAGLCFIGPTPDAIEAMGNKAGAKRLILAAGVPCVPGYEGSDQSEGRMLDEAALIGYPVMIKAAAGGGGRGMRLVGDAHDFPAALQSARSEAVHAFSSAELILERAIVRPRHIEIQVFADAHGNVVHLGERDCSVQRRHQKVIEESPSPAVSAQLRAQMGEVSIAATRAIGYRGAGTLEFLLDAAGQFYFMEMNTRLQVEHAVTEAVVGVDLVEWQLRVAIGEALPLSQDDIDERLANGGHGIEVRLCGEDPANDFLPQSGAVTLWRAPGGVRTDHALASGSQVTPYYDSMLAKLVAHGRDRGEALRRLAHALDECVLLGLKTNRRFLGQCLAHPVFVAGEATTAFIGENFPAQSRIQAAPDAIAAQVGAVLLARQSIRAGYPVELRGFSNSGKYRQPCRFVLDGVAVELQIASSGANGWELWQSDACVAASLAERADVPGSCVLTLDGRTLRVDYAFAGGVCHYAVDGEEHALIDMTYARPERETNGSASGRITSPMNGRVAAVPVAVGERVRSGQVVIVIEAMKMEHSVVSPRDGVVLAVLAEVGGQVEPGRVVIDIGET
ncbi:MAG: biotin carboxylase N-terminal domain-containing protein [Pseudomonadota bacterium]